MCGRFVVNILADELAKIFKMIETQQLEVRYNVAPTQQVAVVRSVGERNAISGMKWGLIPSWSKDDKIASHTINARSETVSEKPSFRHAIKYQRCIIPASGFYEWLRHESRMYDCLAEPSGQTCRPIGSTLRGMAIR
jgi:putative SOS response-associated peptidase YedK